MQPAIVALTSPDTAMRTKDFAEFVLTERVNEFCKRFFSIPRRQRRALWQALFDRCQSYPQLLWRLEALEDGLSVALPSEDDLEEEFSHSEYLAEHTCEAFVLPPEVAGRQIRRAFDELVKGARHARSARRQVKNFVSDYPSIAAMEPAGLLSFSDRMRQLSRGHTNEFWNGNLGTTTRLALILAAICFLAFVFNAASTLTPPQKNSDPRHRPYNRPNSSFPRFDSTFHFDRSPGK